jgi:hypothetical protein
MQHFVLIAGIDCDRGDLRDDAVVFLDCGHWRLLGSKVPANNA